MRDGERQAVGFLFWVVFIAIATVAIMGICQGKRISDLEQRMTTQETVRIEAVAPPEGGQR